MRWPGSGEVAERGFEAMMKMQEMDAAKIEAVVRGAPSRGEKSPRRAN